VLKNVEAGQELIEVETGVAFTAYSSESFFTASLALVLDGWKTRWAVTARSSRSRTGT
jgi:hypothetical protein